MPGLPVRELPGAPCAHPLSARNTWPGGVAGNVPHATNGDGHSNGGNGHANGKPNGSKSADELLPNKAVSFIELCRN